MDTKIRERSDLEIAQIQSAASRAVAATRAIRAGERIPAHRHPRAQLLYCQEGVIRVSAPQARWVLPHGRALWIPIGLVHGIVAVTAARLETVYLHRDAVSGDSLPRVVRVSELARALVERLAALGAEDESDAGVGLVVDLILREIETLPTMPLGVRLPRDPALLAYAEAVLAGADGDAHIAPHARRAGIAERTFVRRFIAETGLSPGRWRMHARLVRSLELMAAGLDVTQTAMELGYQTPSAFSDAFRRTFGVPPSRF